VTTTTRNLPLSGIRVLDFTQVMMGPVATQMLADYGADVIKIERPGTGDLSRTSFPNDPAGLLGPVYCSLNRNKRSVVLDLRKQEDRDLVLQLMQTSDVVVNNFRAGVMERMGFGYEECSRINPRIIYAVGTGFGLTGPYAHKGGQDVLAQAMSGVMARRADASLPLSIYSTTFADYSAGMHLVQGVLLALLQRGKTGRGQKLSVSLLDSMLAAQTQEAAAQLMRGREVNWGAMPLTGVFETSDSALVMVGAFKANPLKDIGTALGIEGIENDARFASHDLQVENKTALHDQFRARFKANTTAYWLGKLEEQDLLCAPVMTLAQALADEQTAVNGMILETEGEVETVRVVGSPIHLSDAPVSIRIAPARLGQHSDDVRAEMVARRAETAASQVGAAE
jgi:crotonobetainyl-CoA:carnitine CoA-transferase CaiB-like acyl-CoA transferase